LWHRDCQVERQEVFKPKMKPSIPTVLIMMGGLVATGCATKKYVQQQVDPVSGKLDQVASKTDQRFDQTNQSLDKTNQSLDKTKSTLEEDETKLSATNERAVSADARAGQALTNADNASQKADRANQGLGDLRNTVANLDDYKQVAETTVNFKFNSDKLDSEAKMAIDQMVTNQTQYKRFFIAVEGFTDKIGSAAYNEALSRRRADAVVEYLVAQHDIPIYRVHMVGLGEQKPVEDARNRAANAKNRRVEVTLFSADQSVALNSPNGPPANSAGGNGSSNPQ
jgi:OOP family OmpA-OmpF porin